MGKVLAGLVCYLDDLNKRINDAYMHMVVYVCVILRVCFVCFDSTFKAATLLSTKGLLKKTRKIIYFKELLL